MKLTLYLAIGILVGGFIALLVDTADAVDTNTTVSSTASSNTVSSNTIDRTPPTASAPNVVINNSDICVTGVSGATQTPFFGVAVGTTIRDENCERLKLARTLFGTGLKVAAVSLMCQDERVFKAMYFAGTPCPIKGKIGEEAKELWLDKWDLLPDTRPEFLIVEAKMEDIRKDRADKEHARKYAEQEKELAKYKDKIKEDTWTDKKYEPDPYIEQPSSNKYNNNTFHSPDIDPYSDEGMY